MEFSWVVTATRKGPEILREKNPRFVFVSLECAPGPAQARGRGLSLLARVKFTSKEKKRLVHALTGQDTQAIIGAT